MRSRTTRRFRNAFTALPEETQNRARQAYRLFVHDPDHPSLRFKRVHSTRPIYSARVGLKYRALGVREDDMIAWFWIGTNAEYERLLTSL